MHACANPSTNARTHGSQHGADNDPTAPAGTPRSWLYRFNQRCRQHKDRRHSNCGWR